MKRGNLGKFRNALAPILGAVTYSRFLWSDRPILRRGRDYFAETAAGAEAGGFVGPEAGWVWGCGRLPVKT